MISRRHFLQLGAAAAVANSLTGCKSTTEPVVADENDPRLAARPGTPTITPVKGKTDLGLGTSNVLGTGRDGIMYVPNSYNPATPAPLFIGLHGSGGSGPTAFTSYYDRCEARGMIMLAPSSRDYTWDLIAGDEVGPDVRFIDKALAHVFARCRIDSSRICLGGFSDGASYAIALGLSNGALLTHIAAYSPGFFAESDIIVGKPKIFISHGTNDPVLSYANTANGIVPALQQRGYNVTFAPFTGTHEVPAATSEAALDWFLK